MNPHENINSILTKFPETKFRCDKPEVLSKEACIGVRVISTNNNKPIQVQLLSCFFSLFKLHQYHVISKLKSLFMYKQNMYWRAKPISSYSKHVVSGLSPALEFQSCPYHCKSCQNHPANKINNISIRSQNPMILNLSKSTKVTKLSKTSTK